MLKKGGKVNQGKMEKEKNSKVIFKKKLVRKNASKVHIC
jgi:hypothetical protein